jgi:hypothetical protein
MAKKPRARAKKRGRTASLTDKLIDAHRQDLGQGRALVSLLFAQLKEAAQNRDALLEAIDAETEGDKKPDRRRKLAQAVSVSSHVRILGDLVTALRNLVPLERQAFDLDPEAEDTDATGLADRLQKARSRLNGGK